MRKLPSRHRPKRSRSGYFLLLLPLAAMLSPACHSGSVTDGGDETFGSDACECCDDATGEFSGSGGSGGAGGTGGTAPMNVCPMGSVSAAAPCAPSSAACDLASLCLTPVSQSTASLLAFRMAQLDFTLPTALAAGPTRSTLAQAALPDDPTCNLFGTGTFSWLLQFDPSTGVLFTGGARPPADPSAGYSFDTETLDGGSASFQVAPAMLSASESAECAFSSSTADLVLPAFLDPAGTSVLVLPLHHVGFTNGRISLDNGCIGQFDPGGLDQNNACMPAGPGTTFADDATVSGFFVIAETDTVDVPSAGESLCVLLSGDPAGYGDGGSPVARCKRDASGNILFKGDWCSTTDAEATPGCEDALRFTATFAAQAVTIM